MLFIISKVLETIKIAVKRVKMLIRYSYGKFSKVRPPVKNTKCKTECIECYRFLVGGGHVIEFGYIYTKYSLDSRLHLI